MSQLNSSDAHINGRTPVDDMLAANTNTNTKRQRRPPVRLSEIGDQQLYAFGHLNGTSSRQPKPKRSSKTRQHHNPPPVEPEPESSNLNTNDFYIIHPNWNFNDSSKSNNGGTGNGIPTKRVRSGRKPSSSKTNQVEDKFSSGGNDENDISPDENDVHDGGLNDQSAMQSFDREDVRARASDEIELDDEPSSDDNYDNTERNGVTDWLNELGLGRYAPLFEIHEVDEEVLPLLTLDDLKEMGINAVGSRRKMYSSIQKMAKGIN